MTPETSIQAIRRLVAAAKKLGDNSRLIRAYMLKQLAIIEADLAKEATARVEHSAKLNAIRKQLNDDR